MRRWLWIVVLAVPALLLGGHVLAWRLVGQQVDRGLSLWVAQREQAGWAVELGTPIRGGYPLAASLRAPQLRLRAVLPGGGALSWHAEAMELRVALWQPWLLHVRLIGAQQLQLPDGAPLSFRVEDFRLTAPLRLSVPYRVELSIAHLIAGASGAQQLRLEDVAVQAEMRMAATANEPVLAVSLRAERARLPEHMNGPSGDDMTRIDVSAQLRGPLSLEDPLSQQPASWRDGGGAILLDRLHLRWGPFGLDASATLRLDAQLQPTGNGVTRMTGQDAALDALAASGLLRPEFAPMAKGLIALFARPAGEQAGEQWVELPWTLQERRLLLRQVPLARLPVLTWPAP